MEKSNRVHTGDRQTQTQRDNKGMSHRRRAQLGTIRHDKTMGKKNSTH